MGSTTYSRIEWVPLVVTSLMLLLGAALFVGSGAYRQGTMTDFGMYDGIRYKVAYVPSGELKLFALVDEAQLGRLDASAGRSTPRGTGVVIGSAEAAMMREEKLFAAVGDTVPGFFGIDVTIDGVLDETRTITDDTHFLAVGGFESLEGEEGVVFVKFTAEGMPKHFYRLPVSAERVRMFKLAEGDISQYVTTQQEGVIFQPLLIGATEAAMMREEKLFAFPGDTIEGFFGTDVRVVGVLEETGTALDMMHVLPLPSESLS
jgi:hypothetical protein